MFRLAGAGSKPLYLYHEFTLRRCFIHSWQELTMPSCDCGRRFSDLGALQQHQISKAHCYCCECDRFFIHTDAVIQHRSALHSFTCFDCDRTFVRPEVLQQHQKSTKHCYCGECDQFFVNSEALGQHLRSPIHATQFHCCDCDQDFVDKQALHQHLADKIHELRIKPKVSSFRISNRVCEQCEQEFRDEKGLEQHHLSVVHNPLSYIKCIGNKRCKKQFTFPSAWLHHLESGACSSKMTREKLHSAVQSNDINRLITGGSMQEYTALIGPDVSRSMLITESIIFTPMTNNSFGGFPSLPHTWEPQSGMLTPNSGSFPSLLADLSLAMCLTCLLCPSGQKLFKSFEAIKNHLSSSAHFFKVFHCQLYFAELKSDRKISQLIKYFLTLNDLM